MQAGWYPDPTGRHEHRYFNGLAWTGDIADDGRHAVDPWGTRPSPAGAGPSGGRNGLATAAMVVGIVAVALGVLMVLFWLVAPLGVVAFVLGLVARRRAASTGVGRPQAMTGLVTGPLAVGLAVVGFVVLWPELRDAFRDATRQLEGTAATVEFDRCEVVDGTAFVSGVVVNNTSTTRDLDLEIDLSPPGVADPVIEVRVRVVAVPSGAAAAFEVSEPTDVATGTEVRCVLDDVGLG